ncbi:MAG: uroporphyrinogen-III synthase [Rikenellaceae bacterium]
MEIKNILISQPEPATPENSPFTVLATKYKTKVKYLPFIKTERVTSREFRQQRVDITAHTAVLLTSRTAVSNFFSICEECRVTVPESMKYFCVSESVALFLQKYIIYRKRKIFFGKGSFVDLMDVIAKHATETFLVPLSEPHKPEIPKMLADAKLRHTKVILSRTISQDDIKSQIDIKKFDLLLFYSPSEVTALKENFGDAANGIRIAAFGVNTAMAVREAGYNLVSMAPTVETPSMVMSIEKYLKAIKGGEEPDTSYIDENITLSRQQNKKASAKVKVAKVKKVAKAKAVTTAAAVAAKPVVSKSAAVKSATAKPAVAKAVVEKNVTTSKPKVAKPVTEK